MAIWQPKPPMWAPGIRHGHPLAQELVGYWPMWEGGGTQVMDVSGNGNNATIVNGEAEDFQVTAMGRAIDLDGSAEYLTIPKALNTIPALSVACWAVWDGNTSALFATSDTASANDQHVLLLNSPSAGNLSASSRSASSGTGFYNSSATAVPTGTPFLAVGIWRGTAWRRAFLNGKGATAQTTNVNAITPTATGFARLNDSTPNLFFDGRLIAAGLWQRQLTESEIIELYADPWSLITPRQRSYFWAAASSGTGSLFSPWYYNLQQAVAA